ncbi:SDR family NAD(P)-dependent oxidoreductase [Sphingobium sp. YR768]|uniref:SDR family NAD(P)-dependent oxidoreductase n=1 Tax=Sphingobium sp. YR768 TaxID=1884365 RepID=UPI0008CAB156|nr:SDR family NAD(P)-dependent oxidoreductase [Sphingobium sp. YR768]SES18004.1 NAD(P)-dependent dehydrogenase, short-chain alcohol dehydrogenase family [Sphingobium sp. YR768]
MNEIRFDGKIALVTGGGAGIGRAHCLALAERGARIVLFDYGIGPTGERLASESGREKTVAAEIISSGGDAIGFDVDVTNDADVRKAVDVAMQHFGHIDILINNAGTAEVRDVIEDAPTERMERQIDIHLRGSLNVTRAVWPHMKAAGGGNILLTGSAASLGLRQEEGHYSAGYSIAKAALFGAMRQLAGAGADCGIKVNLLMPWAFSRILAAAQSDVSPISIWMRENMTPEQVALGVLYLLHESCPATGEAISSGGGRVARMVTAMPPGYFSARLTPEDVRDNWSVVLGEPGDWVHLPSFEKEWEILQGFLGPLQ